MRKVATKRCTKCGETKPLDDFHRSKNRLDGRHSWCAACKRFDTQHRRASYTDKERKMLGERAVLLKRRQYLANPEHYNEQNRRWRTANPEKAREHSRRGNQRYCEKYPERRKASCQKWAKKNPDKTRAGCQRREARLRNLSHDFTEAQWQFMLALFGHRCAYCGRPEADVGVFEQDHVIPLSDGGGYTFGNIVPACKHDNRSKHDRCWSEWMSEQGYDTRVFRETMESIDVIKLSRTLAMVVRNQDKAAIV